MPKNGGSQASDVLESHMGFAMENRSCFGSQNQHLCSAKTRPPGDRVIDPLRGIRLVWSGGRHQPHSITSNILRNGNLAHQGLELQDILGVKKRFDRFGRPTRRVEYNFYLVFKREIVDQHVEHESIELGLW